MEELPTFTKWLTSFGHSPSTNDSNPKSNLLTPNRPFLETPLAVPDSSQDAGPAVADVPPKDDSVQAVDDSISARAGCCCWQTSKSTRRECALKFHLSLRKRKVVTNEAGVVTAVSNLQEEETMVAVGDVLDKEGCGCRCWPTFQICGRTKGTVVGTSDLQKKEGAVTDGLNLQKEEVATNGTDLVKKEEKVVTNASSKARIVTAASNLQEEETVVAVGDVLDKNGCTCRCWPTFQICGRRKGIVVGTSDLQKEEGAVTDSLNLGKEEVATNGPNLVKEEEVVVVVDPDLRKEEGSGCFCGRWGCLPAFQICRRRKVVAVKEEVIVDVPKVEELTNDNVNMKEGDSVGSLQGRKSVDDNPQTFEKEAVASDYSSNVGVPNLQKEGSGCCSCFKCLPTFHICGRRRNVDSDVPNPSREEKVVVSGVSDLLEEKVVATDKESHSKPAQGEFVGHSRSVQEDGCLGFFCVGKRQSLRPQIIERKEKRCLSTFLRRRLLPLFQILRKRTLRWLTAFQITARRNRWLLTTFQFLVQRRRCLSVRKRMCLPTAFRKFGRRRKLWILV